LGEEVRTVTKRVREALAPPLAHPISNTAGAESVVNVMLQYGPSSDGWWDKEEKGARRGSGGGPEDDGDGDGTNEGGEEGIVTQRRPAGGAGGRAGREADIAGMVLVDAGLNLLQNLDLEEEVSHGRGLTPRQCAQLRHLCVRRLQMRPFAVSAAVKRLWAVVWAFLHLEGVFGSLRGADSRVQEGLEEKEEESFEVVEGEEVAMWEGATKKIAVVTRAQDDAGVPLSLREYDLVFNDDGAIAEGVPASQLRLVDAPAPASTSSGARDGAGVRRKSSADFGREVGDGADVHADGVSTSPEEIAPGGMIIHPYFQQHDDTRKNSIAGTVRQLSTPPAYMLAAASGFLLQLLQRVVKPSASQGQGWVPDVWTEQLLLEHELIVTLEGTAERTLSAAASVDAVGMEFASGDGVGTGAEQAHAREQQRHELRSGRARSALDWVEGCGNLVTMLLVLARMGSEDAVGMISGFKPPVIPMLARFVCGAHDCQLKELQSLNLRADKRAKALSVLISSAAADSESAGAGGGARGMFPAIGQKNGLVQVQARRGIKFQAGVKGGGAASRNQQAEAGSIESQQKLRRMMKQLEWEKQAGEGARNVTAQLAKTMVVAIELIVALCQRDRGSFRTMVIYNSGHQKPQNPLKLFMTKARMGSLGSAGVLDKSQTLELAASEPSGSGKGPGPVAVAGGGNGEGGMVGTSTDQTGAVEGTEDIDSSEVNHKVVLAFPLVQLSKILSTCRHPRALRSLAQLLSIATRRLNKVVHQETERSLLAMAVESEGATDGRMVLQAAKALQYMLQGINQGKFWYDDDGTATIDVVDDNEEDDADDDATASNNGKFQLAATADGKNKRRRGLVVVNVSLTVRGIAQFLEQLLQAEKQQQDQLAEQQEDRLYQQQRSGQYASENEQGGQAGEAATSELSRGKRNVVSSSLSPEVVKMIVHTLFMLFPADYSNVVVIHLLCVISHLLDVSGLALGPLKVRLLNQLARVVEFLFGGGKGRDKKAMMTIKRGRRVSMSAGRTQRGTGYYYYGNGSNGVGAVAETVDAAAMASALAREAAVSRGRVRSVDSGSGMVPLRVAVPADGSATGGKEEIHARALAVCAMRSLSHQLRAASAAERAGLRQAQKEQKGKQRHRHRRLDLRVAWVLLQLVREQGQDGAALNYNEILLGLSTLHNLWFTYEGQQEAQLMIRALVPQLLQLLGRFYAQSHEHSHGAEHEGSEGDRGLGAMMVSIESERSLSTLVREIFAFLRCVSHVGDTGDGGKGKSELLRKARNILGNGPTLYPAGAISHRTRRQLFKQRMADEQVGRTNDGSVHRPPAHEAVEGDHLALAASSANADDMIALGLGPKAHVTLEQAVADSLMNPGLVAPTSTREDGDYGGDEGLTEDGTKGVGIEDRLVARARRRRVRLLAERRARERGEQENVLQWVEREYQKALVFPSVVKDRKRQRALHQEHERVQADDESYFGAEQKVDVVMGVADEAGGADYVYPHLPRPRNRPRPLSTSSAKAATEGASTDIATDSAALITSGATLKEPGPPQAKPIRHAGGSGSSSAHTMVLFDQLVEAHEELVSLEEQIAVAQLTLMDTLQQEREAQQALTEGLERTAHQVRARTEADANASAAASAGDEEFMFDLDAIEGDAGGGDGSGGDGEGVHRYHDVRMLLVLVRARRTRQLRGMEELQADMGEALVEADEHRRQLLAIEMQSAVHTLGEEELTRLEEVERVEEVQHATLQASVEVVQEELMTTQALRTRAEMADSVLQDHHRRHAERKRAAAEEAEAEVEAAEAKAEAEVGTSTLEDLMQAHKELVSLEEQIAMTQLALLDTLQHERQLQQNIEHSLGGGGSHGSTGGAAAAVDSNVYALIDELARVRSRRTQQQQEMDTIEANIDEHEKMLRLLEAHIGEEGSGAQEGGSGTSDTSASAKLTPEEQIKLQELKDQSEQQLDLHRQGREAVAEELREVQASDVKLKELIHQTVDGW
jgi:hypothetical protein